MGDPPAIRAELTKKMRCIHRQCSGGNDYMECGDCGLVWDYRIEGPNDAIVRQAFTAGQAHGRAEREPETAKLELRLRQIWWASHGCPFAALYGDDGEMQCQHLIDFKRMPFAELDAWVQNQQLCQVAAAIRDRETR